MQNRNAEMAPPNNYYKESRQEQLYLCKGSSPIPLSTFTCLDLCLIGLCPSLQGADFPTKTKKKYFSLSVMPLGRMVRSAFMRLTMVVRGKRSHRAQNPEKFKVTKK